MKNILIITQRVNQDDPILGFFVEWIKEFAKHYDNVRVVCLEKGVYDLPENVHVVSMGKEKGFSKAKQLYNFYRQTASLLLRRDRPHTIFIHMNSIYAYLLVPFIPLRKLFGIRTLWWKCHAHTNKLIRFARHLVDTIVTCSEYAYPVQTTKKMVVGHGVQTRLYTMDNREERSEKKIIAVGRMTPVKKYEDLIEAVALLQKSANNMPFKVEIIGADESEKNDYFEKLKHLVRKKNLESIITFVPAVSNYKMIKRYQSADILVSTIHTAFDKVVLEAMACGVIPVVSNNAYERLLSEHNLFVDHGDIEGLAQKIESVIRIPDNQLTSLRDKMRRIVEQEYDVSVLIKKIVSL